MGFNEHSHHHATRRPVAAAILGGFVLGSLAMLFFWQADSRWSRTKRLLAQVSTSPDSLARLRHRDPPMRPAHVIVDPLVPSCANAGDKPPGSAAAPATLIITLDDSGNIRADGELRTPRDLQEILHVTELWSGGGINAILSVDTRCPTEHLDLVKRICSAAGARVVQFGEAAMDADLAPPESDHVIGTSGFQAQIALHDFAPIRPLPSE